MRYYAPSVVTCLLGLALMIGAVIALATNAEKPRTGVTAGTRLSLHPRIREIPTSNTPPRVSVKRSFHDLPG